MHWRLGLGHMKGVFTAIGMATVQRAFAVRNSCETGRTKLTQLAAKREASSMRESRFRQALNSPGDIHFAIARVELERELRIQTQLKGEVRGLRSSSISRALRWELPFVVAVLGITRFIGQSMFNEANNVFTDTTIESWVVPFCTFVTIFFSCHCAEQFITSVYDVHKTWFYWSSFCVSPLVFLVKKLAVLGVHFSTAFALTIAYCTTRSKHLPTALDFDDITGHCGVGPLVTFLEKWSSLGLLLGLLPLLVILNAAAVNQDDFDITYALTPSVELCVIVFLIYRLITNARLIRHRYTSQVSQAGASYAEIRAMELPADPTLGFLGTHWWKLPAAVSAVVAIAMYVADWLGIRAALGS